MKILTQYIPISKYTRPNIKLVKIKGLVIHWIGVSQPKASVIRNNYVRSKSFASTQYIIDYENGDIIQCMPENEMAYHVGESSYTELARKTIGAYPNSYLVGIECCIAKKSKYIPIPNNYSDLTKYDDLGEPSAELYKNLVEFAADFCKRNNLDPLTQIYRHYDITGKICHRYYVAHEDKWEEFKQDVYNKMYVKEATRAEGNFDWANNCLNSLINKGIISTPEAWKDFAAYVTKKNVIAIIDSATGGVNTNAEKVCTIDHWCTKCLNSLYSKGIITDVNAWSDYDTMIKKAYLKLLWIKLLVVQKQVLVQVFHHIGLISA